MKFPHADTELGCISGQESTCFRLLMPGIKSAVCLLYDKFESDTPEQHRMESEDGELWQLELPRDCSGLWYQYKVRYSKNQNPHTPYSGKPFADPYSRHVTVYNHYRQEAKSLIRYNHYDWEGDSQIRIDDPRDLVIYETHIKDLVALPQEQNESIYRRWLNNDHPGGISYLKRLGVNAVEFLPLQKFPPPEPPWKRKTAEGFHNTWNPYARNYWGYMTSFFMAPESLYAVDSPAGLDQLIGQSDDAVRQLKDLVKALHREGIAVIMDVVYNHTSLFDINPLCHHMKEIFLRRDEKGKLMNRSGTGNEVQSEHPHVQKLIVDSIRYWIEEFHIDGFRFDLAGLIDEKSWDAISETARQVNPHTVLIAEPWGGRYVPWLFSNHGWSSWNDRFRNGIKGSDPTRHCGFIFSDWHHNSDRNQLENWFRGTIRKDESGLFQSSKHAVNYLESHDGYTLGDFIRIAVRYQGENPVVEDHAGHLKLREDEMKIAKLGIFSLMVTPGIAMIHCGQEFARSKIIAGSSIHEERTGRMDENSYNKDDETNWIAFEEVDLNKELFTFYRGMIQVRTMSDALKKSDPQFIQFDRYSDPLHLCAFIDGRSAGDLYNYYYTINATQHHPLEVTLPSGVWELLVNNRFASVKPIEFISGTVQLPPMSVLLLRKLRH